MLGNELVRNLVGTWMVPDRYLVVDRYLVGTSTVPYVRTVPVRYGTLPSCRGLTVFMGGLLSTVRYRYRTALTVTQCIATHHIIGLFRTFPPSFILAFPFA